MADESKHGQQQNQGGKSQVPSKDSGSDFGTRGKAATNLSDTDETSGPGQTSRDAGRGQQSGQGQGGQGQGGQGKGGQSRGGQGMETENQGQMKDKSQRPGAEDVDRDEGSEQGGEENNSGNANNPNRGSNASREQRNPGQGRGA